MEPYTLNRNFIKQFVIDGFESIIWTERYYGDSGVELVVPATIDMLQKLPVGTFLALDKSAEIMILESMTIDKGKMKLTGISLLPWLDNRFVRTSANHEDQHWYLENGSAGWTMWAIVYYMCVSGSPYLNGSIATGIANPQQLAIPGLGLRAYDDTGGIIKVGVPYGPVFKALKEIATTYEIGQQITLDSVTDSSYFLGYRNYKGLDRTTDQVINSAVRFSPQMDSFTDMKDLQSIAALKTQVYSFAPGLKPDEGQPPLTTIPGVAALTGPQYTGFDLRALMTFEGDISTDMVGGSQQNVVNILNSRAFDQLTNNTYVKSVDGEIVPDNQFKYGVHYNLGDIVEVEGNTGVVQAARITEYIRSQDSAGEKAYPTVTMIG